MPAFDQAKDYSRMDQFIYFAINMLYAVCLCVSVAMGIVFCISGRTFGTQKKLQRYFGVFLLLFAAHLLILNINFFFGKFADSLLQHVLVIADIIALLCCAVFILKSLIGSYSSEHSELSEPRVNDRSGSGKASGTHAGPEDIGDSELSIESVSHETSENSLPVEDEVEESEDETETVEKLESPNVYDYLFFQKVEALMVNEKLFCEQEISRETVAHAIGTNRTYLARSIKSATGKTFSEYINDLRTVYAAKLLSTTDEPLDMIGTLVGFRSKSAYYRAFSAAYNCSPSEYRKNSIQKHNEEQ